MSNAIPIMQTGGNVDFLQNFAPPLNSNDYKSDYDLLISYQIISIIKKEFLPNQGHLNFIIQNWYNLDSLNDKYYELNEKKMNNTISPFEKELLYSVLKTRILEFPNPHLPLDYEESKQITKEYKLLKKKMKERSSKKLFNIFFSWLS